MNIGIQFREGMRSLIILIVLIFVTTINGLAQSDFRTEGEFFQKKTYNVLGADSTLSTEEIVSLMTFEEKISLIGGYENFFIAGLDRFNIPKIALADGPMGVKAGKQPTPFPASIAMAASWNPELIESMAVAMGKEANNAGISVLLGPGTNLYRVPHCGRNFEYYGEDPLLASKMVVSFINGIQSQGVMACVKHFVANNEDYDRHRVSSEIDLKTLNEIYFPPFKAAVQEANVGAIMTSYNLLNGVHTSESSFLIQETLRKEWGFEGIVMSDWISVYSTNAFMAGLDLEMPRAQFMNAELLEGLFDSEPKAMTELDNKVYHILNTCRLFDLWEKKKRVQDDVPKASDEMALQVAREGIVLLKNENAMLPISKKTNRIFVLGPNAVETPYSGGGAARVEFQGKVSLFRALGEKVSDDQELIYIPLDSCALEHWDDQLAGISERDMVILALGFNHKSEGEGFDRPFQLPEQQNTLIDMVSQRSEQVLVLINSGGGIEMPWLDKVEGLIYAWYGGVKAGEALADVVFGDYNPSGRLPISLYKKWIEHPAAENYDTTFAREGVKPFYTLYGKAHDTSYIHYEEGMHLGYRSEAAALFPFGYGLSYTNFDYTDFEIQKTHYKKGDSLRMSLKLKNSGEFDGADVVQVYASKVGEDEQFPVEKLIGFTKVDTRSQESRSIELLIDLDELEVYNSDSKEWELRSGEYQVEVKSSALDVLHTFTIWITLG
jgi:beta-glucosidase